LPCGQRPLSVGDDVVTVKGPNGTMTRQIPDGITLVAEGDTWDRQARAQRRKPSTRRCHGLDRARLVANMVTGVTDGWSKELEIIGVGYSLLERPVPVD